MRTCPSLGVRSADLCGLGTTVGTRGGRASGPAASITPHLVRTWSPRVVAPCRLLNVVLARDHQRHGRSVVSAVAQSLPRDRSFRRPLPLRTMHACSRRASGRFP